ncbi:hypothetical protein AAG906_005123 [Vitis piasezkii]
MLPVYRYMDSHPHQGNQMPFLKTVVQPVQPHLLRWVMNGGLTVEILDTQCRLSFPTLPSAGTTNAISLAWVPSHVPGAIPCSSCPAPYYSMEQTRPEYEKNDSGNHHCCGLPNHGFNRKGGNNVKIEEHEADDGKKERESLVPAGLKDCPYPIVWIPPVYMKNGENRAPVDPDTKEQSENRQEAHDATSPKSFNKSIEWEPGVWNRWFPPDSNGFRSLKQGGEGKRNQQSEDKNARFPFPIIWMPPFEKTEEGEEKEHKPNNSASKPAEEPNLNFKIIPVKLPEVGDGGNKPRATEEKSGGEGGLKIMEKNGNQNNTPVKEREAHGKRIPQKTLWEPRTGAKQKEIKVVKVVDQTAEQNVDNISNCGSQNQILTHSQSPVNLPIDPRTEVCDDLTAEKPGVAGGEYQAKKDGERNAESKISEEAIEEQKAMDKIQSDGCKCKIGEDKAGKNNLSDSEAAVIIQSAYRGFEVRKWEPLKKLKQLAKVREEADEIRNRIQALESLSDLQRDNRQRVIIGETIMSLLLKLDAIQGLHPNLRNFRKSLARELVSLQEKLDSLMNQKPEVSVVDESTAKSVENLTNDVCMAGGKDEEKDKEATESLQDNSSEDNSDKTSNFTEPSQSPPEADASVESQGEDTSEPMSFEEELQVKSENDTIGVQEKSVEPHAADMGPVLEESKDEQGNGDLDVSQVATSEPNSGSGLEGTVELPLVTGKSNHETGFVECPLGDAIYDSNAANKMEVAKVGDTTPSINEGHLEMNEGAELPQGVIEEETATNAVPESKDGYIEAEEDTVQEGDQVGSVKTTDVVNMADYEAPDMNEPEQHPIDENPETHELEALLQHGTEGSPPYIDAEEAKISEGSQAECDEAIDITSRDDEAPNRNQLEEHSMEAETKDLATAELQKEEVSETEEPQPMVSFVEKEPCHEEDKEDQGAINVDETNSPGADSAVVDSHKKEVPIEETKEESLEGKFEPQEVESVISDNPKGSETAREEAPGTQSDEEATGNQVVIQDTGKTPDEKLIEENKKLREMMEQLINAGKEQLTVISNLTGRVNDLERKLSRKKKLRTRRHRAAAPSPISVKP